MRAYRLPSPRSPRLHELVDVASGRVLQSNAIDEHRRRAVVQRSWHEDLAVISAGHAHERHAAEKARRVDRPDSLDVFRCELVAGSELRTTFEPVRVVLVDATRGDTHGVENALERRERDVGTAIHACE